ncbi:class I SAM-dependent methyltransferase [Actinopolymorpha sp. NPDC004070]|uniref:class I SAM-dependent methyltransferase n=1 Tax=Actinopolymorpha sp. NPDC004070 TaxID=3154548 RepID=UPI0033B7A63B
MSVGEPWRDLASDYENARQRPDSLDRILEWPMQQEVIGDPQGLRILDLGCGSGAKAVHWARHGAAEVVGVDITGQFVPDPPDNVRLISGDLSDPDAIDEIRGRVYDRILFLQSLSYAKDQVHTLRSARGLLAPQGRIIVQRSHPVRFAVERAEVNGTSLGEEYYSTDPYQYASRWNANVTLTRKTQTIADMLNAFAAAGLHVERAIEPQLTPENQNRYPHKQEWLNRHLGVVLFVLRAI